MAEAIDWHIRQLDPAFSDWEALTARLENDPELAKAFAALSVRDEMVAGFLASPQQTGPSTRGLSGRLPAVFARRTMTSALGVAAAASFALGFAIFLLGGGRSTYAVTTGQGVQETVALEGGTTIVLNGNTRLILDKKDPRFAKLEQGEAVLNIVHDGAHPFRLLVDDAELVDLGTRFNVLNEGPITEIAVGEGRVMYRAGSRRIDLPAGRSLKIDNAAGTVTLGRSASADVGSWAEGRLVYDNAPISKVAADLARAMGSPVTADADIANRRISAVIQLKQDRAAMASDLELLLQVRAQQQGDQLVLKGR